MSETTTTQHHDDHEGLYWKIGGLLFVLTIATVLVSRIHFPAPFGLILGVAIAVVKASLVAAIFMHLKWEKKHIHNLLILTCFFAIFLFILPIIDGVATTDRVYQSEHPAILDTGKSHDSGHGSEHP